MARRVRNNDFTNRQFLRDRGSVERPAAAVGYERKIARIETALQRHVTHRIGHRRRRHLQHAGGGSLKIDSERLGELVSQGLLCRDAIEAHFPAEKTFG